eukprot:m.133411 g.133411  ORF g.133411 m.133411 type:complete len:1161 (+) comp13100_c0_seq1:275-3757(+)
MKGKGTVRVQTRRGSQFAIEPNRESTAKKDKRKALSSRKATISEWQAKPFFTENFRIGDDLPPGWTFATTQQGTPYYINHDTRDTQWIDPRLLDIFDVLASHNKIRLAAYRASKKLRSFQCFMRFSEIHIIKVLDAFYALDFLTSEKRELGAVEINDVMGEVYKNLRGRYGPEDMDTNIVSRRQIMTSWLLTAFDRYRTGRVPILSAKIALALLSIGWVEEKYRYVFGVLDSNQDNYITREQLTAFIQICIQILDTIEEGFPFCPNEDALKKEVDDCVKVQSLMKGSSTNMLISLEAFVEWAMDEPRCLKWLPTLHRIAATENMKHEAFCSICRGPIIGFRYRSLDRMNVDICQNCYWTGNEGNGHKASHKMMEYSLPSTMSQDVKDFRKKTGRKMTKLFTRKKKKKTTELTAPNLPPLDASQIPQTVSQPYTDEQRNAVGQDVTDASAANIQNKRVGETDDDIDAYKEGMEDNQMSTVVVSLETKQKLHLLRVIDELDSENRDLVRQLMDAQESMNNMAKGKEGEGEGRDSIQTEMQKRMDMLNERNKQLVDIINKLEHLHTATNRSTDVDEDFLQQHEDDGDEFSDVDIDALDLDEITQDTSDEQELLQAMGDIENVFVQLSGSHRDSMLESFFNPYLLQSLINTEKIGNGIRHAVLDIRESITGQQIPNKPQLEVVTDQQRFQMHGGHDLPDDASDVDVETHSNVLRRGRQRHKATLNRLSVYNPDVTMYALHGDSAETMTEEVASEYLMVEVEKQKQIMHAKDARIKQLEAAALVSESRSSIRNMNTSFQTSGQYTYTEEFHPPHESDIESVDDDMSEVNVNVGFMPKRFSMDAVKTVGEEEANRLAQLGEERTSTTSSSASTPTPPDSFPPPPPPADDSANATKVFSATSSKYTSANASAVTMASELLQTPVAKKGTQSGNSSRFSSQEEILTPLQRAQRSRELLDTPPVSSRPTQKKLFELEATRSRTGSTSNNLNDDSELSETVRRVGGRKGVMKHLSMDRKHMAAAVFRQRLLTIMNTAEDMLEIPLGVAEDNVEYRLLSRFADGQLLCQLVNQQLQERGLPTVNVYLSDSLDDDIGMINIVSNFNSFLKGWQTLGYHPADAPAHLDFNQLSNEFKSSKVKDRIHHTKIMNAIEKLLNIVRSKGTPARVSKM